MLGPARMPAGWPGNTSSTICDIRMLVPCSRPLTSDTTGTHGRNSAASSVSTPRNPCDGTPITTTSAHCAASAKSEVARRLSDSTWSSPRYLVLRWFSLMSLAVSSERTHCSVGPRRAQIEATVVPQEPPPRTTTFGSRVAAMAPAYCRHPIFTGSWPDAALSGQRRLLLDAAEHHGLGDPVEAVVDGGGVVVLPNVPRPLDTGFGQRMRRAQHVTGLDVPRRLLRHRLARQMRERVRVTVRLHVSQQLCRGPRGHVGSQRPRGVGIPDAPEQIRHFLQHVGLVDEAVLRLDLGAVQRHHHAAQRLQLQTRGGHDDVGIQMLA